MLAPTGADLKKIVGALRVCTSNGVGNINGGPPAAPRRTPLALPLPPRELFRPALPSGYTPAISLVGTPTKVSTTFAPKLTLPVPSGLQAGHELFIIGTSELGTAMSLADASFIPVGPVALYADNGTVRVYLWRKHLADVPPATIQIDLASSNRNASAMALGFDGVDAASPVEPLPTYHSNSASGASRSMALGPFTFTRARSLLVVGLGLRSPGASIDSDGAATFYNQGNRLIVGLEQIPEPSSRGRTLMSGMANVSGVAFGLALRPAP